MTNKKISKRADALSSVRDAVMHLWHTNEGPFQNTFKLLSYATLLVPGIGWAILIMEKLASMAGYGLEDLGKYIDQKLGLGSGGNLTSSELDRAGNILEDLFESKSASANGDAIIKNALWGGILKFAIPNALKLIAKFAGMLALAIGVDQVSDIYKKINSQGGVEQLLVNKGKEVAESYLSNPANLLSGALGE